MNKWILFTLGAIMMISTASYGKTMGGHLILKVPPEVCINEDSKQQALHNLQQRITETNTRCHFFTTTSTYEFCDAQAKRKFQLHIFIEVEISHENCIPIVDQFVNQVRTDGRYQIVRELELKELDSSGDTDPTWPWPGTSGGN